MIIASCRTVDEVYEEVSIIIDGVVAYRSLMDGKERKDIANELREAADDILGE